MEQITELPTRIETAALDLMTALDNTKRMDQVHRLYQRFIKRLGFDNAACIEVTNRPSCENDVLMNSRPDAWTTAYFEQGQMAFDPVIRELSETWVPFSWCELRQRRQMDALERSVIDGAGDFGMKAGFVVPILEKGGYSGVVSMAGSLRDLSPAARSSLTLGAFYLHNRLRYFKHRSEADGAPLTKREHECLNWVAAGKSDWQIGQILNVSQKTVNFHVENAKRKFGVATRIQAVVAALSSGHLTH